MPKTSDPSTFEFMTYAEFGVAFFEHAVNPDRITASFANMAGQESTIGPMPADPLGVVKVKAKTRTGAPTVKRMRSNEVKYSIAIPIELDLTIDISPKRVKFTLGGLLPDIDILGGKLDPGQKLEYHGDVVVNLALTARAAKPLRVVIDIEKPRSKSVEVKIEADGILAELLKTSGILEGEIKKAVANEVRNQLASPELQSELIIDVGAEMDDRE